MIIICHSLGLDGTSSDNLIPSGDVVTISTIDVAVELPGSRAVIAVLQDEEKGTPMHDPSNGVVLTSSGWVEHN